MLALPSAGVALCAALLPLPCYRCPATAALLRSTYAPHLIAWPIASAFTYALVRGTLATLLLLCNTLSLHGVAVNLWRELWRNAAELHNVNTI